MVKPVGTKERPWQYVGYEAFNKWIATTDDIDGLRSLLQKSLITIGKYAEWINACIDKKDGKTIKDRHDNFTDISMEFENEACARIVYGDTGE